MAGTNDSVSTSSTATVNPLTSFGIWVAVRVRPFNKAELGTQPEDTVQPVVEMERDRKTMALLDPGAAFRERATFSFDFCFSPFSPAIVLDGVDRRPASTGGAIAGKLIDDETDDEEEQAEREQAEIYTAMGSPIVNSAWQGYNSCIFAYGQTSSGKTYTMMGTKRDPGIIPRLCRDLFERVESDALRAQQETDGSGGRKMTKVSLSYMEIYNERVKDLLKTRSKDAKRVFKSRFDTNAHDEDYQALRVRQHPLHGPFVEGLTKVDVTSWLECVKFIRQGNEVRSQCSTSMNESSSRSHAIFQLVVTQTEALGAKVRGKEVVNHKVSKINLVDLAGSERITRTNVTGKHVTEANHINKSLSTLRKVIDALVSKKKPGQASVVPYRESLLTWILADNFGGNSKTAMIANISPHSGNFAETESTLRYATLAKGIVNRVRVNEDPSAKLIRELQAQLRQLQTEMASGHGGDAVQVRDLEDQMEENKKAMEELIAREEGMRVLIHESRLREEQLREQNETLEKDQQRWKHEAARLKREKEELKQQLAQLAKMQPGQGGAPAPMQPGQMASANKSNFWLEDETTGMESSATGNNDDETCPPQQNKALRRRASMTRREKERAAATKDKKAANSKPVMDEAADDTEASSKTADNATKNDDNVWLSEADVAKQDEEMPPPLVATSVPSTPPNQTTETSRPGSVTTPTPASHGRRAVTQDGSRKPPLADNRDNAPVRSAEVGRRRRGEGTSPTPTNVPPTLQHLVAQSDDNASPAASPPGAARQPSQPDALDSFLNGTGSAPATRERGKPWRQGRGSKPNSVSNTPVPGA